MATPKLNKEVYKHVTQLKLLHKNSKPKFVVQKTPFDEEDAAASSTPKDVIIGRIFPDSEPFKEGSFQIELKLPPEFPFSPPAIRFLTPIYHPSVEQDGKFCDARLLIEHKWKTSGSLVDVVSVVVDAIDQPDLDHAVRGEVGREYKEQRAEFNRKALEYIKKHALSRD